MIEPSHISNVPVWSADRYAAATYDLDGLCHCDPQPDTTAIGECPHCHRLDPHKTRVG
jgi:hypothetical protein